MRRFLESAFEAFLFNSRLIVILAVLGSLTSSVLMFVRGVIVIVFTAREFLHHVTNPHSGEELSIALISSVDSFLFATVLLIFAMGIYELFISKIDPASRTEESRPNWLQIHSLDDLKGAVGKVILMILIVRLFESAVKMKYDTPLHLLYLGLAVLFVAASLFLQHAAHKKEHGHEPYKSDRDHAPAHGSVAPPAHVSAAPPAYHAPPVHAPAPAPAHFAPQQAYAPPAYGHPPQHAQQMAPQQQLGGQWPQQQGYPNGPQQQVGFAATVPSHGGQQPQPQPQHVGGPFGGVARVPVPHPSSAPKLNPNG